MCVGALGLAIAGRGRTLDDPEVPAPGELSYASGGARVPERTVELGILVEQLRAGCREKDLSTIRDSLGEIVASGAPEGPQIEQARGILAADPELFGRVLDGDPEVRADAARSLFGEDDDRLRRMASDWFGVAADLEKSGRTEDAERVLGRVVAVAPENLVALRMRADLRLARGAWSEAAADYERLADTPLELEVAGRLGRCHGELERWAESLSLLEQAYPDGPPTVEVARLMGAGSFALERYRKSVVFENRALDLGGVERREEAVVRLTRLTNLLLDRVATDAVASGDLDFRPVPPSGTLRGQGDAAWLAPDPEQSETFHLQLPVQDRSRFVIRFGPVDPGRRVRLSIHHESAWLDGMRDGRVSLSVNDRTIEQSADLTGGGRGAYERDITEFCIAGENAVAWRLAADARTPYLLRRVSIVQE